MQTVQFSTQITYEQLYSLLLQLSMKEKLEIANRLRAEVSAERMKALGEDLPLDLPISLEEIVAEVKEVRKTRHSNK